MSEPPLPTYPKVFVSYSHDNAGHRQRILLLPSVWPDGFETMIDEYVEGTPPQGWPRWMLNQIDWADYVLLVCTETYYRRFRGREAPEVGKGVDWEAQSSSTNFTTRNPSRVGSCPCYLPAEIRLHSGTRSVLQLPRPDQRGSLREVDRLPGRRSGSPAGGTRPPPDRKRKTGSPLRFEQAARKKSTVAVPTRAVPDLTAQPPPGGTMAADDEFYIERGADRSAKAAAAKRCETIVIKGPASLEKAAYSAIMLPFVVRTAKRSPWWIFTV